MARQVGNLGSGERVLSALAGLGLTLAAMRGGPLRRATTGALGMSFLSRAVAGHCAMKAALSGESTLRDGVRDQWQRLRSGVGTSAAAEIDSLEALYWAELQELNSAEAQLLDILDRLPDTLRNPQFERLLQGYVTELRSRHEDLDRILASSGHHPRRHPDNAMEALVRETRKMSQVPIPEVRDAAVLASLQRLIHFKIAGYGTVATYAKTLDRIDEAARLGEYADRDKAADEELSQIAKDVVNAKARRPDAESLAQSPRPH